MQKVSLILLLFITFITAQSVYIEDRREITKQNIIDSIRYHFFAQRCGGVGAVDEDGYILTDCLEDFLEVQRIMQELSAIKMPKTLISKYFVERFEPAAQYIERYIQKDLEKDSYFYPNLAERVTYQKELHKKYANVTITQKMITSLNKNITTLKNQQKYLEQKINNALDTAYKNDSSLEALISKKETLANTLKSKAEQEFDPMLHRYLNGMFHNGSFMLNPYVAPLFTKEEKDEYKSLAGEIASREKDMRSRVEERFSLEKTSLDKNLVLLREEIDFLKKQYEIQKVEKMSQAQLTKYVIEHSSCSKEELLETDYRGSRFVCPEREEVVADAKKGFYNTEILFFPFKTVVYHRWTDDEGNEFCCDDEPKVILYRARSLYNVAQAFKHNDIPALVKFLNSFSPTTQEEQVLIKETIEAIKTTYRIDDKKMWEFLYGFPYID